MNRSVLTTAFLVSIVASTLSVAAPSPALACSSLAVLVRSEVMSAVGGAKGAAAEAEMRQLRAKAAMAAKAKAAMEAEAAVAKRSGGMPPLPVACPFGNDGFSRGEPRSLGACLSIRRILLAKEVRVGFFWPHEQDIPCVEDR
jgi:hypothetical protein